MDPLDPARDEIQAAIRKAHVLHGRGDTAGAEKLLNEALEKYPDHPDAQEARADMLADAGKYEQAKDIYGEIVARQPGRIGTERKHAEMVLKLAEDQIAVAKAMDKASLAELMNPAGAKRTAGTASFLSLLAPGFGQIYNGYLLKGVIMLALAVVLFVLLFTVGYVSGVGLTRMGWGFVLVLLTLYIAAIIDAAVSAPKSAAPPRPERPTPPVDKPFE